MPLLLILHIEEKRREGTRCLSGLATNLACVCVQREEKALVTLRVWKPIQCVYKKDKERRQKKWTFWNIIISILFQFLIMHITYDSDLSWLSFELIRCDTSIYDDLIKGIIWLVVKGNKQSCRCHLIDEFLMRYDLNLVQFLLSLMEIMCLVQEMLEMPRFGWLKLYVRELETTTKWIRTCNIVLVKHLG